MTGYAQIARQPVLFLTFSEPALNGRVPRGDVTIVAGEGGAGKGQMAAWMAVDQAMQGHHVVLVTPEDNLEATVRPRLEATIRALAPGCDDEYIAGVLTRVHDLTYTRSGAPFELSADGKHEGSVGQLRELVDNPTLDSDCPDPDYAGDPAALVVIDPLLACLAYGTIATNLGARRVLGPLMRLAGETGCGLVLTHHTVESGKVAGSKGLVDAARLVYRARRDRENPGIRVLAIDKSNILAESDPVRYQIQGDGADTYVRWLDRDELAARRTAWRDKPQRERPAGRPAVARGPVLAAVPAEPAGVALPAAMTAAEPTPARPVPAARPPAPDLPDRALQNPHGGDRRSEERQTKLSNIQLAPVPQIAPARPVPARVPAAVQSRPAAPARRPAVAAGHPGKPNAGNGKLAAVVSLIALCVLGAVLTWSQPHAHAAILHVAHHGHAHGAAVAALARSAGLAHHAAGGRHHGLLRAIFRVHRIVRRHRLRLRPWWLGG